MTDSLAGVRNGYDRWAPFYDHDENPLQALEEPVVRTALGEVRELRVLDLGCGTGRHALWCASRGAEVVGVDFSRAMLEEAGRKPGADKVRFLVHDLHQPLPFAPIFDLLVSGLVLEHLQDLGPFFAEAFRVLLPGSRAVVSAMHPAMFLRGTQARFADPATGERVHPGSRPHALGTMILAAMRAGFRPVDIAEVAPDSAFAERCPRAAKYVDWPMLVVLQLSK